MATRAVYKENAKNMYSQLNEKKLSKLLEAPLKFDMNEFSNWENPLAIFRIMEMILFFDRSPDILSNNVTKRNTVIWTQPGVIRGYWKLEINENAFLHSKPQDHADFFFVYIRHQVEPEKVKNLHKISDSITYYPLGKIIGAGCHFRGAGVAALSLVKEYSEGVISIEQAIDSYDRRIMELEKENEKFDEIFQKYTVDLKGNIKSQIDKNQVRLLLDRSTPITNIYESYITTMH